LFIYIAVGLLKKGDNSVDVGKVDNTTFLNSVGDGSGALIRDVT